MPAMPPPSPARRPGAAARLAPPLLAVALLAGALAGCGPKDDQFPPACPSLALVPDAGDIAQFSGGQDITNLVLRMRITAVPAKCELDKPGLVRATLHVDAEAQRGPAAGATIPPIPYFIALMRDGKVLNEQDFTLTPSFPANVDRGTVHGDEIELLLPVGKDRSAAAYRVFAGFRLTPQQLAYNRAHPRS